MTATVYIADANQWFRDRTARLVREHPDLQLIGDAADGSSALHDIRRVQPTVAILDCKLPSLDGLDLISGIRETSPVTTVVILTTTVTPHLAYELMQRGATTVLSKDADKAEISNALTAATHGDSHLPHDIATKLADERQFREQTARNHERQPPQPGNDT